MLNYNQTYTGRYVELSRRQPTFGPHRLDVQNLHVVKSVGNDFIPLPDLTYLVRIVNAQAPFPEHGRQAGRFLMERR